jgi:hypothetical protein
MWLEVAFMLALSAVYLLAKRLRLHGRWLGCRSLAEAFRGGLFITITGAAGQRDGEEHSEEVDLVEPWYQRALSEAWRYRPRLHVGSSHTLVLRAFLVDGWIDSQIHYHRDARERYKRASCSSRLSLRDVFMP